MTDILNTAPEEQKVSFLEIVPSTNCHTRMYGCGQSYERYVYLVQVLEELLPVLVLLHILKLTYFVHLRSR